MNVDYWPTAQKFFREQGLIAKLRHFNKSTIDPEVTWDGVGDGLGRRLCRRCRRRDASCCAAGPASPTPTLRLTLSRNPHPNSNSNPHSNPHPNPHLSPLTPPQAIVIIQRDLMPGPKGDGSGLVYHGDDDEDGDVEADEGYRMAICVRTQGTQAQATKPSRKSFMPSRERPVATDATSLEG